MSDQLTWLPWAMRGLCLLGAVASIASGNWVALIWVVVATLQHERAERRFL